MSDIFNAQAVVGPELYFLTEHRRKRCGIGLALLHQALDHLLLFVGDGGPSAGCVQQCLKMGGLGTEGYHFSSQRFKYLHSCLCKISCVIAAKNHRHSNHQVETLSNGHFRPGPFVDEGRLAALSEIAAYGSYPYDVLRGAVINLAYAVHRFLKHICMAVMERIVFSYYTEYLSHRPFLLLPAAAKDLYLPVEAS